MSLRITWLRDAKIRQMRIARPSTGSISLALACFCYLIAVTQRSNLGVSALEAIERFEVSATQLASLGVLQLAIYAAMQVPVGVLLDRYGAKTMLVFGSLIMGAGQFAVALAPGFEIAALGRMLVGFGDAFIFISLTRTVNAWYQGTKASVIQQLVANLGQIGQVLSAIPFHLALQAFGWAPAFALAASASVTAAFLSLTFLKSYAMDRVPISLARVKQLVSMNMRDPATKTAFWAHFTLQSTGSSFVLLWGYPYLVSGQLMSPTLATALLTSFVFVGFIIGPIISTLASGSLSRKFAFTTAISLSIVGFWTVVIASPGELPLWLVLTFILVIGVGGPASMMAFDYSRQLIPSDRMGTANGLINTGGFIAAFALMFLVGLGLDLAKRMGISAETYSNDGFRFAFLVEPAIVMFGLWHYRRQSLKLKERIVSGE